MCYNDEKWTLKPLQVNWFTDIFNLKLNDLKTGMSTNIE
jgi:hypothetical protein